MIGNFSLNFQYPLKINPRACVTDHTVHDFSPFIWIENFHHVLALLPSRRSPMPVPTLTAFPRDCRFECFIRTVYLRERAALKNVQKPHAIMSLTSLSLARRRNLSRGKSHELSNGTT